MDHSLGYARAERDLACRYTVGLYVKGAEEDKTRRIELYVRKPGLRVQAPNSYLFRSDESRKESLVLASFISPDMFDAGILRTHAFPLRPNSKKGWETILLVNFQVRFDSEEGAQQERDFGIVLQSGNRVVHSFNRRMTLRLKGWSSDVERDVTFVEFVDLEPGLYTLTTSLLDPNAVVVDSRRATLEVPPPLPKRQLALVSPILGQPAGSNVVVAGNLDRKGSSENDQRGTSQSFQPLLIQETEQAAKLLALTRACLNRGDDEHASGAMIDRSVTSGSSPDLAALEPVPVQLRGQNKVRCDPLLDTLPTVFFDPGKYVFEALLETGETRSEEYLRFAVESAEAGNIP
jgi:hypothetical protein